MPISPMKGMPSSWPRLIVRRARVSGLLSLGSRPNELSMMALSLRRVMSLAGLGVTVGGPVQNPPLRKFLALVRPVDDGQFNGKHLTVALRVLGARGQTFLADAAGLDVYDEGGLGPLRDFRFELRWWDICIVICHHDLLQV